ncbi:hypothetical protein LTR70_000253 [Exophiala xenobiotica]|uniref:F-box domain-containing protein n=1 Tax=Lithohypha guttulata TaxID=1690604 RepID=A0ABR0K5L0_9EURO|nr:hypothetical protein LTR24_007040 [Lithohypha guttulata]KAK5330931.1 hypothetical protein LTR70_000253 [Exophiala xenobiotica]
MNELSNCTQENGDMTSSYSTTKTSIEGSRRVNTNELLPSLATIDDASSEPVSSSLLVLPNELLHHVFSFLDEDPPSERIFTQLPSRDWTDHAAAPLKALSTVSHRVRAIVVQSLFKHARLDPCRLTPFLEFVHQFDLASSIESMVAHVSDFRDCFHPAWYVRLLNEVPATRLVVGCEPHAIAETAGIQMNLTDRWAFNIPYQYLELRQPTFEAIRQTSYDYLPGLLGAKHWESIRVNEGSSLAAYTSYEYFLKKPPSLLSNVHTCLSSIPFDPENLQETFPSTLIQVALTQLTLTQQMLQNLQGFSFVAVFPFYNHVDDILKCIRRMRNLKRLFIKLCPEPESMVLDEAVEAAEGHIDLNDPWNEITTAYTLVAHTIRYMAVEGRLERVVIDDTKIEALCSTIVDHISATLQTFWTHNGKGVWTRSATITSQPLG